MPRRSSTSRADLRRQDRNKVYAVVDPQQEGTSAIDAHQATSFLLDESSVRATLSREESSSRVSVRAGDRKCSQATAVVGSVGPGAEPPVAVASHAFAHEEPHEDLLPTPPHGMQQEVVVVSQSRSLNKEVGDLSREGGEDTREDFESGGAESTRGFHGKNKHAASSLLGSVDSNEEEASTLPGSFNLSDEYAPEGASTGRNQNADDDDVDPARGPRFLGSPADSCNSKPTQSRRQRRPSSRQISRSSRNVDISSRGRNSLHEEDSGGVSTSASDSSGCWLSSSRSRRNKQRQQIPQYHKAVGRRTRQGYRRQLLTTSKRNARIVPFENLAAPGTPENQGARRNRRASSRSSSKYRPSVRRRHPQGPEDSKPYRRRRRGASECRSRGSRRSAPSETESVSEGMNNTIEAEMTRLRRENEALKQQQERSTRSSGGELEPRSWNDWHNTRDSHLTSRAPFQHSSRWRDLLVHNSRDRAHHATENNAARLTDRQRSRSHASISHLGDMGTVARPSCRRQREGSTSRPASSGWSDSLSKSARKPRLRGQAAWGMESLENAVGIVELSLPRVLVEGGFLWKIPYHNAGTPKRRWFQIKPGEGLLTTASGRLVVRPAAAGGDCTRGPREGAWDEGCNYIKRDGDVGSGGDMAAGTSMIRIRTAWPLAFIWVDPDKDLKRSPPREIRFEEITDLARGHKTPAFWQQAAHRGIHTLPDPKLCFSLVGSERTLDLAAETLSEAKEWVQALARLALMMRRGELMTAVDTVVTPDSSWLEPPVTAIHADPVEDTKTLSLGEKNARISSEEGSHWRQNDASAITRHVECSEQDLPALSESCFLPKTKKMLGEEGAWSVDTLRAWRRRMFPAVTRGDIAAVVALFDQGCPVDLVQKGTGDTPMLLACRLGDIEITRECLRRGCKNDPHPDFGQTALQAAVASGQEACARLLLETAAPSRSDAVVSNHKDPNKETPLHVACRRGYSGIVEALLHHGSDMRVIDRNGNTPLHGAGGGGHANALASLLDAGGDAVLEERNVRGESALHAAAASGHIACVELLLGTAAEPDVPNKDGQTPFALASRGGHLAVTRLIRQYAPAAGTPSGGDAQFQAQRRGVMGTGSVIADALPRPHGGGTLSNGSATQDRGAHGPEYCSAAAGQCRRWVAAPAGAREATRGRSAASMGMDGPDRGLVEGNRGQHRSVINPQDDKSQFSETTAVSGGDTHSTYPLSPCSPRAHGSLFDGLQVYVVGGRQPLGSQRTPAATSAGMVSTSFQSAVATARNLALDSRRHIRSSREQQLQSYLSTRQDIVLSTSTTLQSTASLDPNWKDNVLSAPSTMAPSPPVNTHDETSCDGSMTSRRGDTGLEGMPGSARALARVIHFSNSDFVAPSSADIRGQEGSRRATGDVVAETVSSGGITTEEMAAANVHCSTVSSTDSGGCAPANAVGSWMKSNGNKQDSSRDAETTQSDASGMHEDNVQWGPSSGDIGVARMGLLDGPGATEASDTGRGSEPQTEGTEETFKIDTSKDDIGPPEGVMVPSSGIWRVYWSQGYPYYVHEASGHSQWEDPREKVADPPRELSSMVGVNATATVRDDSGTTPDAAAPKNEDECTEKSAAVGTVPAEKGVESLKPTSHISSTRKPVEAVSRCVDAAIVPMHNKIPGDCGSVLTSEPGEGKELEDFRNINVNATKEQIHCSGGTSGGSIDVCGNIISRNIESVDTSGPREGNDSRNASEACLRSSPSKSLDKTTVIWNNEECCWCDADNDIDVSISGDIRQSSKTKSDEDTEQQLWYDSDEVDTSSLVVNNTKRPVSYCSQPLRVCSSAGVVGSHNRTGRIGSGQETEEKEEEGGGEEEEKWWQGLDNETKQDT